jgi:hypothetical protein
LDQARSRVAARAGDDEEPILEHDPEKWRPEKIMLKQKV